MVILNSGTTLNHAHLQPVHTGDYSRQFKAAAVSEFGDSRRFRRLSPKTATVGEFGDCRRFKLATIVSSVDRALLHSPLCDVYNVEVRRRSGKKKTRDDGQSTTKSNAFCNSLCRAFCFFLRDQLGKASTLSSVRT